MPENAPRNIQNLLQQAADQSRTPTRAGSSVVRAKRVFSGVAAADKAFDRFHEKLFQINLWNDFSAVSTFELFDEKGNFQPAASAIAAVGDHIKITLPGSGKSDWVTIAETRRSDQTPDEAVLAVRPSPDPTAAEREATVSHFFDASSTNNFCLQKNDAAINFYVIGLDEKTNLHDANGIIEAARNLAASNIGHYLGLQAAQWQIFCDNFLETNKD